jgi:hypothetical protein
LQRCDVSVGEKTIGFIMEQMTKKRKHQQLKNSPEKQKTRLIKTSAKRRKMNTNTTDKYKGKGGTKTMTIAQLKQVAKEHKIPMKRLTKKADIEERVRKGMETLCWVDIPLMTDLENNPEGEFF